MKNSLKTPHQFIVPILLKNMRSLLQLNGLEVPASKIAMHQLGQLTMLTTTKVLKPPQRYYMHPGQLMAEEDRQLSTMRLSGQLFRLMVATMIRYVGA
jgi:hypothetical protein